MNILYPNTAQVSLKKNKPTESWMKDWSLEERLDKFFEFCEAFDQRQDHLLKTELQIFSHRLHWHEHPFVDLMQDVKDLEKLLTYVLMFSFTNEHWLTVNTYINESEAEFKRYCRTSRVSRSDLFQIYYPKGTVVKEWISEVPAKAAKDLVHLIQNVDQPYTMMQFTYLLEGYFKQHLGFRGPKYPCKNASRYLAMARPDLVDPNTPLHGGTGHFDGLQQIFGGVNLNGKGKFELDDQGNYMPINKYANMWYNQMDALITHPKNPIHTHQYLNIEDKTCFFYKHIAISHSVKSATKKIPYEYMFPCEFEL